MVTSFSVIRSRTLVPSKTSPFATCEMMSRAVKMPTRLPSSVTGSAPFSSSSISWAASGTSFVAPIATTSKVILSFTFGIAPPFGSAFPITFYPKPCLTKSIAPTTIVGLPSLACQNSQLRNFRESATGELRRISFMRLYEKASNAGQPPRHEANHGSIYQRFAARTQPLEIFAHPPVVVDPRKRSLHNPPPRQHLEAFREQ